MSSGVVKTSFRHTCCEHFGCLPDQFEQRVFWTCLYRHALPFAWILSWFAPSFFQEDFAFLRDLGAVTSRGEALTELNRFYGRNVRDRNWLRKTFAIRVSGKRVLRLYRSLSRAERQRKAFATVDDLR